MAKCKYCRKPITRFDQDICPHCGGTRPLDDSYQTMDMTHAFPGVASSELYKSRRRKTAVALGIVFAPFGAMYFYLGFKVKGWIQLLVSLAFILIAGTALYLTHLMGLYSYAVCLGAAYLINLIFPIHLGVMLSPKDAEGELLR